MKACSIALMLLLGGCTAVHTPLDDGYDPGDVGRTVFGGAAHLLSLRQAYCTEGDYLARQGLLLAIRQVAPAYPRDGLCTHLLEVSHAR